MWLWLFFILVMFWVFDECVFVVGFVDSCLRSGIKMWYRRIKCGM